MYVKTHFSVSLPPLLTALQCGPEQLCALAHLGCICAAGIS